jgi:Tol biopolymer transport system component
MWNPNSTATNYEITFLRDPNKNGNSKIYLLSFSNSSRQLTQLTDTGNVISYAAWSKDGDKIAYVKDINNGDIFVMDMINRQEYPITNTAEVDIFPMWSPTDNNKLLFIRKSGNINNLKGDIFIAVVNISNQQNPQIQIQIQPVVNTDEDENFAVWSPDGNKIAFIRTNSPTDSDIIVKDLTTGSSETNLLSTLNGIADFPMWSPVPRP